MVNFIREPKELPEPTECGIHKIRTKQWLTSTNTLVYFWNYGRVWQFFGLIDMNHTDQMLELINEMKKLEE